MDKFLEHANVATGIAVLLALVGAVVVIVGEASYNFQDYFEDMKYLIGFVAVGRGVAAVAKRR